MSKVLITGGAGFIGTHLARVLLHSGHDVRILDCLSTQIHGAVPTGLDWLEGKGIEFVRGSVTDRNRLREAIERIDVVVHLAAETGTGQSMYEIAHYTDVNVGGTALLLDVLANASQHTIKRVVLASSRAIYGEGAYICPFCNPLQRVYPNSRILSRLAAHQWEHQCNQCSGNLQPIATLESDPANPASIYAATKFAQEDLLRIGCSALNIDYAILRLQNVYGEGQSLKNPYTGILSIFSTLIRYGQHLPIFEDGQETRDFVHVQDVANAFLGAIEHQKPIGCAINVGTGVKTSVAEIAGYLSDAFGAKQNLVKTGEFRMGDIRHNFADVNVMYRELGRRSTIPISEGMRRFAQWVNTQRLPDDRLGQANAELKSRGLMG